MKRIFLFTLLIISLSSNSQTIWVGTAGDHLWSNSTNWNTGNVPNAADDVLFNTSDSVFVDAPYYSGGNLYLNSLKISNNANVLLTYIKSGGGITRNIKISAASPTVPYGLEIETGAKLTISCNYTYTGSGAGIVYFNLSPTNNGSIAVPCLINGELIFTGYVTNTNTGHGDCYSRLDTYLNTSFLSNCIVNGKIKYYNYTGNTNTDILGTTLTFNNGSSYEIYKDGGFFPAAYWYSNSTCKYNFPNSTAGPIFSGKNYGNLEWYSPNLNSDYVFNDSITFNKANFISTGSKSISVKPGSTSTNFDMTINDSLIIGSSAILSTSNSSTTSPNGGKIILKGNLLNNGTITKTGPSGTRDTIEFAGTANQVIKNLGTISNQITFKINNPTNIFLESPLSLPYHLLLKNGKVNTTNTNLLTLSSVSNIYSDNSTLYTNLPTATYNNFGFDNSYIVGPIKKLGLSATSKFGFPVGSATWHRPLFLNNATGDFTVEYKNVSPRSISTTYNPALNHISDMEYWEITGTNSPTANVELTFYDPNSGGVTNMADLQIAHYNGTQWDMVGNNNPLSGTLGTAGSNGAITSNAMTSYSPYALASTSTANPLPVFYNRLKVTKNKSSNFLEWQTNNDVDVINYELQKSENGIDFIAINTNNSLQNISIANYNYTDYIINAKTYYRIKSNLKNNNISFSNIVLVNRNLQKNIQVFPNPASDNILLVTDLNEGKLLILDFSGKIIKSELFKSNNIQVNIKNLSKGNYLVKLISNNGLIQFANFVKE